MTWACMTPCRHQSTQVLYFMFCAFTVCPIVSVFFFLFFLLTGMDGIYYADSCYPHVKVCMRERGTCLHSTMNISVLHVGSGKLEICANSFFFLSLFFLKQFYVKNNMWFSENLTSKSRTVCSLCVSSYITVPEFVYLCSVLGNKYCHYSVRFFFLARKCRKQNIFSTNTLWLTISW